MKIVGIDGNSLMHRAFYALPPLTNPQGLETGAVYGFMNMLFKVVEEQRPDYLAVAFDMHGKTFRHEAFADYKAGRKKTPEELRYQFDMVKEALTAMGVAVLQRQNYEADDILGYLAKTAKEQGMEAVLITGDKDALQLAGEGVQILLTKRGITDYELLNAQGVYDKMGVWPDAIPELKGLMGDTSDNIPGVPGVGPKTAVTLLSRFGTVEEVLSHASEAKGPKLQKALVEYRDQARMSRDLAVIDPHVPDMPEISTMAYHKPRYDEVKEVFTRHGFTSLLRRIAADAGDAAPVEEPAAPKAPMAELIPFADAVMRAENEKTIGVLLTAEEASIAGDGFVGRIAIRKTLLDEGMERSEVLKLLLPVLGNEKIVKITMDAKALAHEIAPFGATLCAAEDVMLAAYVRDPALGRASAAALCERYGITDVSAHGLLHLFPLLMAELKQEGMEQVYREMELPLYRVLFAMEQRGFKVDVDFLRQLSAQYAERITGLEEKIYESVGKRFNINSPKQLGQVLFEELKLPVIKKTKSGYSTDAEVLEQLSGRHEVVDWVLEYRKAAKLKSTYLDGLTAVADPNSQRIHTRFTQNITATGRLSSIEPNLQNIPVRTEQGREIRKAFIPFEEGRVLIAADYSQIELRLLAHFAMDDAMIEVFQNGGDIHTDTAARVFNVDVADVTKEMRSAAKAVNFGIVYGISDFGLAKNIGVSRTEAAGYIETYFARFPGVKRYLDRSVADGTARGYTETLFARRRYLPELKSRNYNMREFGKRVAMNAPIQGTAADIIKLAMIRVEEELKPYGEDAVLILQVHDELIVDCAAHVKDEVAEKLSAVMGSVVELAVPLIAEVGFGENWLDAK
ncbi:MAG: DNA polymerase I [Clostridiales bacterium]|nr:DNA polymerase I [Clostridiales bacterium]